MSPALLQRPGPRGRATGSVARVLPWVLLAGSASAQAFAPRLLDWDTDGSDTLGFLAPAGAVEAPVTTLRLRFDTAVAATIGDFLVVHAGNDGRVDSTACTAPAGDDVAIALVAFDVPSPERVVLGLDAPTGLAPGTYGLLACDSLRGVDGTALDGDDDGLPGGNARREFAIAHDPQLDNPGFAHDLSHWRVSNLSLLGSVWASWDALDADASASSGAMRVGGSLGAIAQVASDTCIPTATPASAPTRPASLRLRYRVLTGQVRFIVAMRTGFAGDGGPDSCIGPHLTRTYVFDGGGPGPAFATHDSGHFDLAAYPNGEVAIRIVGLDGAFEVLLDDIGFNFEGERVFGSSFEGGLD